MNQTYKTFAIFGNTFQAEKSANIQQVLQSIADVGGEIIIEREFANFLAQVGNINSIYYKQAEPADIYADYAVSIGGDGTFLKTAQLVGTSGMPIVGINTGRLGFISDLHPNESKDFFRNLIAGNCTIEQRSLLHIVSNGEPLSGYPFALNEIAVLKHDMSSMISISTYVDGNYLTTYQADGLLVSTPTGSTGYSLSTGGPILSPDSKSIVLSPIAAHSLSVRPFVLNDNVCIRLKVNSRSHNYMIAIDGRSEPLNDTTEIQITKASYCINIVRPQQHSFFETLRNKLLWGVDKR